MYIAIILLIIGVIGWKITTHVRKTRKLTRQSLFGNIIDDRQYHIKLPSYDAIDLKIYYFSEPQYEHIYRDIDRERASPFDRVAFSLTGKELIDLLLRIKRRTNTYSTYKKVNAEKLYSLIYRQVNKL